MRFLYAVRVGEKVQLCTSQRVALRAAKRFHGFVRVSRNPSLSWDWPTFSLCSGVLADYRGPDDAQAVAYVTKDGATYHPGCYHAPAHAPVETLRYRVSLTERCEHCNQLLIDRID